MRIARKAVKVRKMVAKPQYKQHVIYDENMVAIQLKKTVVNLNKPRYIGMCILDLSKLVMYRYHYDYIMPKYPGTKLLFTDTDSFCYWIPTKTNLYDDTNHLVPEAEPYTPSSTLRKLNHPLMIMVKEERVVGFFHLLFLL